MTNNKKNDLTHALAEAVVFSDLSRCKRFTKRPLATLSRALTARRSAMFKINSIDVAGRTFWGQKMHLKFPDDASIYQWGFIKGAEEELTRFIVENIKQGNTVFDVGAHHGFYSLLTSILVGETGSVHSFEPIPDNYKVLERNISANKVENVACIQKAAFSDNGTAQFIYFGERAGAYSMHKDKYKDNMYGVFEGTGYDKMAKEYIEIDTIKLDSYSEECGKIPNFVKLDVEGSEIEVLRGMKNLLENTSLVVSVEFWGGEKNISRRTKIVLYMRDFGFSPWLLENGNLKPYEDGMGEKYFHANVIFKK